MSTCGYFREGRFLNLYGHGCVATYDLLTAAAVGSDDPTDRGECGLRLGHGIFGRERSGGNSWVENERPERRTQLTYILPVVEPECQPQEQTQGPMNKGSYEKKYHSWRYDSMARGRPLATRNMCWTKMHYIYRAGNRNRSNSLS